MGGRAKNTSRAFRCDIARGMRSERTLSANEAHQYRAVCGAMNVSFYVAFYRSTNMDAVSIPAGGPHTFS